MRQVVVIGGGDAFATYEEALAFLKNEKIESLDYFKRKSWKSGLGLVLGEEYEVVSVRMPNPENAKYLEWKIWFEKIIPFLQDGVVLVGHSLGGIFVAKYLGKENFPKKIRATFLLGAPYDADGPRKIVEFDLPPSLERFLNQSDKIFLYHSTDDPVVAFSELAKYQRALPSATARVFSDRGHFNQEEFPEIVADIKSL